jgi:hypothetical protein
VTTGTSVSVSATAAAPAAASTTSIPGREFKETRLQIRLASGGQPLTTTLPSDSSCVSRVFSPCEFEKVLIFFFFFFFFSFARGGGVCCWAEFDGGR